MKVLLGLGSNGAAVAIWRLIPAIVKYPIIFGLGVLCMAEVNSELNQSLRAPQIVGGEAAKGQAQIDDPVKTRDDMDAGLPVTGAGALIAVKVAQGDAGARTKQAQATADTESVEDIEEKKQRGAKLTTTEDLAYAKVQVKENELSIKQSEARAKIAEAQTRQAQATAASAKAKSDIAAANYIIRNYGDDDDNGNASGKAMDDTLQSVLRPLDRQ
jgi:hypothetical protein